MIPVPLKDVYLYSIRSDITGVRKDQYIGKDIKINQSFGI